MSQNLTISETGLKLIKAFEGYRPVDRELITGQRVVGYGHRLYSEDAVIMNKGEAETMLRSDLEPFEDMINSEVHAPMTQSQFDALCSFAFNIGPKAFLQSDTLRAINNGRPLDAANALDIWRKSEIDGKTYVVDALMRRRTAEKALFLRTEKSVTAGRANLPPKQDTALTGLSTDDGLPILTEEIANGIVATAPYSASAMPSRRREDGPAGALQLSELDIIEEGDFEAVEEVEAIEPEITSEFTDELEILDEDINLDEPILDNEDEALLEPEPKKSPIAAASADIVARLDALIDDVDGRFETVEDEKGDSLDDDDFDASDLEDEILDEIQSDDLFETELEDSVANNDALDELDDASLVDEISDLDEVPPIKVIDELAQDDAIRVRTDSAAKYIEQTEPVIPEELELKNQSTLGLWIPILLGFILVGIAGGAMIGNAQNLLGEWGPIITFSGLVIGAGLVVTGIYASLRMNRSR